MLALTTKYAIKALMYLAQEAPPEEYLQVKTLSDKAGVPGPYLAKIIKTLAARQLVETKRGLSGGVRLARRKKPITFHDVCTALDDPIVTHSCFLSRHPCNNRSPCPMHDTWGSLREQLSQFLKEVKLETR